MDTTQGSLLAGLSTDSHYNAVGQMGNHADLLHSATGIALDVNSEAFEVQSGLGNNLSGDTLKSFLQQYDGHDHMRSVSPAIYVADGANGRLVRKTEGQLDAQNIVQKGSGSLIRGVAYDKRETGDVNYVYYVDEGNNVVERVAETVTTDVNSGEKTYTYSAPALVHGDPLNLSGAGLNQLDSPQAVFFYEFSSEKRLYIADTGNHRIVRLRSVESGSPPSVTFTYDNAKVTAGVTGVSDKQDYNALSSPSDVWVGDIRGEAGVMLIADKGNHRVLLWANDATAGY